ncbi:MAG: DegT/DnrJ/EryC1/StrS family aminotransferase [Myxococcota bacterium]
MSTPIPFLDLPRQHAPLVEEITEAIRELVTRASFVGGPVVSEFEAAFAEFCEVGECIGVANGTEALMLGLMGAGVDGRSKVVLPTYTFIATAEAVSHLGARIVLVDVDRDTGNLSVDALREIDGAHAVIPVHLYGQPADMGPLMDVAEEKGWAVVEDCAQAHGARYDGQTVGSFGAFGAFSFYPTKNLGAIGDAGAVVGPKGEAMDRIRRLANHGRSERYTHTEIGVNSRLDSLQAAALTIKLAHIQAWNQARVEAAEMYTERLETVNGLTVPSVKDRRTHVFHLYLMLCEDRVGLGKALKAANIGFGSFYETPLHLQPAYAHLGHQAGDFPNAEYLSERCISLPLFPGISESQIDRVCGVVREFMSAGG